MSVDFASATHTIILSDIHLADSEPIRPRNPLWKRFKHRSLFVDDTFSRFLEKIQQTVPGPIELILNGDIFDFDSVMSLPKNREFSITWLERERGLAAEEDKSLYKIGIILTHHQKWVQALRTFILQENRVIFNIGNHDMELHWPSVRRDIVDRLELPEALRDHVRFTEWFYISNQDTLVEHGNQYDAYCLCSNPINPLIEKRSKPVVRLPFGNLAGKYMLNGMGLMNPHVDSSFIKESVFEYIVFFFKYVIRTQPLLIATWFWSALVTMVVSLEEGFHRALSDPLTIDARVDDIASRSNTTPRIVWALKEVHVHPAIFNPFKILRELWLDRAILFGLILYASFQFFTVLNVFVKVSILWTMLPLLLLMPMFIFYARSVESDVGKLQLAGFQMTPISARIARVNRVVQGHTHREKHTMIQGVEYVNTGTWSPAFRDVECTQPYGRKCFAWIRPSPDGEGRVCGLYEWNGAEILKLPSEPDSRS